MFFKPTSFSTAPLNPMHTFMIPKLVDEMLVTDKNTISSHLEKLMFFFFPQKRYHMMGGDQLLFACEWRDGCLPDRVKSLPVPFSLLKY